MTTVHEHCRGEAIGEANRATAIPGRLTVPDTHGIVGELTHLTRGLDRLCRQLADNLDQRREHGVLHRADGGDPYQAALHAAQTLRRAASQTDTIAQLLDGALDTLHPIADSAAATHGDH